MYLGSLSSSFFVWPNVVHKWPVEKTGKPHTPTHKKHTRKIEGRISGVQVQVGPWIPQGYPCYSLGHRYETHGAQDSFWGHIVSFFFLFFPFFVLISIYFSIDYVTAPPPSATTAMAAAVAAAEAVVERGLRCNASWALADVSFFKKMFFIIYLMVT